MCAAAATKCWLSLAWAQSGFSQHTFFQGSCLGDDIKAILRPGESGLHKSQILAESAATSGGPPRLLLRFQKRAGVGVGGECSGLVPSANRQKYKMPVVTVGVSSPVVPSHRTLPITVHRAESRVRKKSIRLGTSTWLLLSTWVHIPDGQKGPGFSNQINRVCSARSLWRESFVFELNSASNLFTLVAPGWAGALPEPLGLQCHQLTINGL